MHYQSRKYRTMVEWIALNDNPGDSENVEEIAGYMTVTMLAHCYNLRPLYVAEDVMAIRMKHLAADAPATEPPVA
jgi:hypothetical protein